MATAAAYGGTRSRFTSCVPHVCVRRGLPRARAGDGAGGTAVPARHSGLRLLELPFHVVRRGGPPARCHLVLRRVAALEYGTRTGHARVGVEGTSGTRASLAGAGG